MMENLRAGKSVGRDVAVRDVKISNRTDRGAYSWDCKESENSRDTHVARDAGKRASE